MSEQDLGPKPEPEIEPGEPNPGGADAIDADETSPPVADLDPDVNPAVDDSLPEEMKKGEDTTTKATKDEDDVHPEEDEPA